MGDNDRDTNLGVRKILPAYRQISDQLRSKILSGELQPGARLPNETEMSSLFGVSRSTVREALRELSSQTLLTTKRGVGGGTFVVSPEPSQVAQFLEASLGLMSASEDVTVAELLEFRGMLEVPAARLAAERHTDEDLEVLEEVLEVEAERTPADTLFEGHRAFHQTVLEASGNALLEMVARPIFTILRTRFLRDEAPASFWNSVADDHVQIYRCIADKDVEGAEKAMRDHLAALAGTYEAIDRQQRGV